MTVNIDITSKKYRGAMAAGYEAKRKKQLRWKIENEAVEMMLTGLKPGTSVLDVPVGTGRFLPLYQNLKFTGVGVDISEEMLAIARKKSKPKTFELQIGSAINIFSIDGVDKMDVAVCVRFLDLIDEKAMKLVMTELTRVARKRIVLTIRLGAQYVAKSNTATHNERSFRTMVRKLGWQIVEEVPVFKAGWYVMRLERVR